MAIMKKQLLVGVALGLLGGGLFILTLPNASTNASTSARVPENSGPKPATVGQGTTATQAADTSPPTNTPPVSDNARRVLAAVAAANAATGASAYPETPAAAEVQPPPGGWEKPSLTRMLPSSPPIRWSDRPWAVLGTQDYSNADGQKTALALQDQTSGQVEYRQSALRVVLEPGVDYEAFIRTRSNASRLFVNSLYGDLAVDAAQIAAEYNALAKDPRVAQVSFIPLVTPIKPR